MPAAREDMCRCRIAIASLRAGSVAGSVQHPRREVLPARVLPPLAPISAFPACAAVVRAGVRTRIPQRAPVLRVAVVVRQNAVRL